MKKFLLIPVFLMISFYSAKSSGVCIVDAYQGIYFRLIANHVSVLVNDQIATVVTTQEFRNLTGADHVIKYAFPLHEEASATNIRWKLGGVWYTAVIAPEPQDTTLPGGGNDPDPDLVDHLGETPLYFTLLDTIPDDSTLVIELTYVQLLPYEYSKVDFFFPNNYELIQTFPLNFQSLDFRLYSQRTIEDIQLFSPSGGVIGNYGDSATIFYEITEVAADFDYSAQYELNSDELGLFAFSTFFPDSMVTCDDYGNGFFTFIVEPDPNDSLNIIQKVFTLIIDRSGSMTGIKMVQAKEAANYIINNLNEGDYFNIVDFETFVSSFQPDHVPFTPENQQAALDYIYPMYASGSTNISGAFGEAIPDFAGSDSTIANIIIFFTDGQATSGIIGTDQILEHIQNLISYNEVSNLSIHTFGIGADVNYSLLSQIASQNNGLCHFLENEELLEAITEFYNMIRNPVLLNPVMTIDPPVIVETYPNPLTNLYIGHQLIITGRYDTAVPVTVTFSGEAYGIQQEYIYNIDLADTVISQNQFLTKLWAKQKMEYLYVLYFTFDEESPEAEEIKNLIIDISICYNVISPFTNYTGGGGTTMVEEEDAGTQPDAQRICRFYPNPFSTSGTFNLRVEEDYSGTAFLEIFDNTGKVVMILEIEINGQGNYEIRWDGKDNSGNPLKPGIYLFTVTFGDKSYSGKIFKM
ncbi:MAG: VWA domain-containing protein [Bacteroidales bacterium]|nr:VWA domain-containing protein [Bacteroidales bacterium]